MRSHNLVGDVDSYLAPGDIYLAPVTGGDPVRLIFGQTKISGLAWMPDSSELVFAAERDNNARPILWRIPAAGGTPSPIVGLAEGVLDPTISSKGGRLAFSQLSVRL